MHAGERRGRQQRRAASWDPRETDDPSVPGNPTYTHMYAHVWAGGAEVCTGICKEHHTICECAHIQLGACARAPAS